MAGLRTQEMELKYRQYRDAGFLNDGCNLCKKGENELVKEFEHWKVMKNIFPYDLVATENDMIMPKRHIHEKDLNDMEIKEFQKIKEEFINPNYDIITEATHKKKSIPDHFHLHLLVLKS